MTYRATSVFLKASAGQVRLRQCILQRAFLGNV